jgi:hypothetical protein
MSASFTKSANARSTPDAVLRVTLSALPGTVGEVLRAQGF